MEKLACVFPSARSSSAVAIRPGTMSNWCDNRTNQELFLDYHLTDSQGRRGRLASFRAAHRGFALITFQYGAQIFHGIALLLLSGEIKSLLC